MRNENNSNETVRFESAPQTPTLFCARAVAVANVDVIAASFPYVSGIAYYNQIYIQYYAAVLVLALQRFTQIKLIGNNEPTVQCRE